ncbi:MAG: methyltransferase domain-containing protein [Planctomycetes bacterium]|nr:methyltransferase domain-containing protein [Planctomycetota bacterium]
MSAELEERLRWVRALPVIERREEFLAPLLGEGPLLDIGCIDERRPERIAASLHAWIRSRCPEVHGIDADERAVEIAAQHGFAVRLADAERDDLGGPYATIVAGEVIEHVGNAGAFLRNLARHLRPEGLLLLTTPNPFSFRQSSKILRRGEPQVHARHTAWLDPLTLLEAAAREGLQARSGAWILPARGPLLRWLARRRPFGCEGFAVALVRRAQTDR